MAENKRTCTFAGCEQPQRARGYCTGHYQQQLHGKPIVPLRATVTLAERMALHTDKTGDCWLWTAGKNEKGYGRVMVDGSVGLAHRVAYELAYGPIPEGMEIDHRCRTRACVRPDHLRPATHKQNAENQADAQADSKSGVRGVSWHSGSQKWRARVGHNGQEIHLGSFATIEEAGAVARAKRLELFTHNDADRGRPPVSTPDDFAAALGFLRDGTGYREASRTTGVPYSTLRERYPGLGLDSSQGGSIGVSILRSRVVGLRG